ncbi:hypothetical protein BJ138DRAFT_1131506 [Hygrophoropsis aurantiaca]|uniref:Uncharacterized protein n=1 Tax=Hygrophoropsis aurantiaca TaxID=72124 RepID=A0ACB7ZPT2_9AGAM|nr:hypothetical protein BJ138DRAFT_1131506 [Hygrophoropsis aurantiaca]
MTAVYGRNSDAITIRCERKELIVVAASSEVVDDEQRVIDSEDVTNTESNPGIPRVHPPRFGSFRLPFYHRHRVCPIIIASSSSQEKNHSLCQIWKASAPQPARASCFDTTTPSITRPATPTLGHTHVPALSLRLPIKLQVHQPPSAARNPPTAQFHSHLALSTTTVFSSILDHIVEAGILENNLDIAIRFITGATIVATTTTTTTTIVPPDTQRASPRADTQRILQNTVTPARITVQPPDTQRASPRAGTQRILQHSDTGSHHAGGGGREYRCAVYQGSTQRNEAQRTSESPRTPTQFPHPTKHHHHHHHLHTNITITTSTQSITDTPTPLCTLPRVGMPRSAGHPPSSISLPPAFLNRLATRLPQSAGHPHASISFPPACTVKRASHERIPEGRHAAHLRTPSNTRHPTQTLSNMHIRQHAHTPTRTYANMHIHQHAHHPTRTPSDMHIRQKLKPQTQRLQLGVQASAWRPSLRLASKPPPGIQASTWRQSPPPGIQASTWRQSPPPGVQALHLASKPPPGVQASTWRQSPPPGVKVLHLASKSSTWRQSPPPGVKVLRLASKHPTWRQRRRL